MSIRRRRLNLALMSRPGVFLRDMLDFCLPATCVACGQAADDQFLCTGCNEQLSSLEGTPACTRCAMPLAEAGAPCPYCQGRGTRHYDQILALGKFEEPIKTLIHHLKYHRRWTIGELLGRRLARAPRIRAMLDETDCLVAVPLHARRRWVRGYNQAEMIARGLASEHPLPLCRPAVRTRNTETQTHLQSRARRVENLRGAFALVRGHAIAGKRVIVVDDVMTSGATLQSVARVLRRAQPKSLTAIVIGIADPRGRQFQGV